MAAQSTAEEFAQTLLPTALRMTTLDLGAGKYVNEIKIRPIGVFSHCWCNGKSRKMLIGSDWHGLFEMCMYVCSVAAGFCVTLIQ